MAEGEGRGRSPEPAGATASAATVSGGSTGSDVFISYASQDDAVATAIVENLENRGLRCWIAPRDVKPGAQYADAIVRAINEADYLVLVLSGNAVSSPHVGREVERGASKRKPIVAFRIDAAPLSPALEYFLSNSQWIDVPALGMPAALVRLQEATAEVAVTFPPGAEAVPAEPAAQAIRRSSRGTAIIAAVIIGIGALALLLTRYLHSSHPDAPAAAVAPPEGRISAGSRESAIADKSIAVLPFVDMSERKDQEYFADGMAEEILDLLVNIPGLKVIGRTSSFQFKGQARDLRAIGKQLGAAYVLQGSVRKSADRLRVTAQLINSKDGSEIFAQTYDRSLSDVLRMQDEIATHLVRALQIEVGGDGVASRATLRNVDAYTAYLQGLHAFDRNDQQGFELAVGDFQRALDLDPSFADAAAALGSAYFVLGQFGYIAPGIAFEKARSAAQLALRLDPKLARAHAALAEVYRAYDWDWAAAERELNIARDLAPHDADVLFISAVQAQNLGYWDDALKYVNASLARDPLNPSAYMVLNIVQLRRGRLAEAEVAARRTLEISPTFIPGHYFLGRVLLARGQPQAALSTMLEEPDDASRVGGSAMAYFALGRRADSDAALKQLLRQSDRPAFFLAQVYAFRDEIDAALSSLDRGYAEKDPGIILLKSEVPSSLESDPRYKAFLRKVKLPES
jgi:TolB-like protein